MASGNGSVSKRGMTMLIMSIMLMCRLIPIGLLMCQQAEPNQTTGTKTDLMRLIWLLV